MHAAVVACVELEDNLLELALGSIIELRRSDSTTSSLTAEPLN